MLGFIGLGAMGEALVRGMLAANKVRPEQVVFSRRDAKAGQALARELGVRFVASNLEVIQAVGSGQAILAVKPFQLPQVLEEIRGAASESHTVLISVAAGMPLSTIESALAHKQPVVRVMPNVASAIRQGVSAICANEQVREEQKTAVEDLFSAVGLTVNVAEKDFSTFSAIAGCSPAWTFMYIDALSRAAVAAGMYKKQALEIAAKAVQGAAELALKALNDGTAPLALMDTVTSPGGTTIAGVVAAEHAGFCDATVQAVQAAIARDKEIAQN